MPSSRLSHSILSARGVCHKSWAPAALTVAACDAQLNVDKDDLNYVRVLTQICEVDTKRYEDVMLIGGTPRIIQVGSRLVGALGLSVLTSPSACRVMQVGEAGQGLCAAAANLGTIRRQSCGRLATLTHQGLHIPRCTLPQVSAKQYLMALRDWGCHALVPTRHRQILRAHLVTHKTLLPDEAEIQRRCMRFLERGKLNPCSISPTPSGKIWCRAPCFCNPQGCPVSWSA